MPVAVRVLRGYDRRVSVRPARPSTTRRPASRRPVTSRRRCRASGTRRRDCSGSSGRNRREDEVVFVVGQLQVRAVEGAVDLPAGVQPRPHGECPVVQRPRRESVERVEHHLLLRDAPEFRQERSGGVREVEKAHRHDDVEVVVGERQARGVATHELHVVVDAGRLGLRSALLEHRSGDVEADDVGAAFGEHHGEPAGPAGDFEDGLPLDGADRVQHRFLSRLSMRRPPREKRFESYSPRRRRQPDTTPGPSR